MRRLRLKRGLLAALRPARLLRALLLRGDAASRARTDPHLRFFSEVVSNDMLHYGYFDDPGLAGDRISFADIEAAQVRYAELVAEAVREAPVLDVGSGLGGIARLLRQRGYEVDALTPNRHQAEHLRRKYQDLNVFPIRFESFPEPAPRYGTILMAESFQYLRLEPAFDMAGRLLRPGGRWVICDYFQLGESHERSGHVWSEVARLAADRGWRILEQRDITAHVLPTLRFGHLLATRLGQPLARFATRSLERKRPRLSLLLSDLIRDAEGALDDRIESLNPIRFAAEKRYLFLVLVRRPTNGLSAAGPASGPARPGGISPPQ